LLICVKDEHPDFYINYIMNPKSVKAVMVKLDVAEQPSLFILLGEDGSVNRLGTGAVDNDERDMFIGRTNEPLFLAVRSKIRPEWMERFGSYDIPDKVGSTCKLSILFSGLDSEEGDLTFVYGAESHGPPPDICDFVRYAVRVTNRWYEKQKRVMSSPNHKKPWWRFW